MGGVTSRAWEVKNYSGFQLGAIHPIKSGKDAIRLVNSIVEFARLE